MSLELVIWVVACSIGLFFVIMNNNHIQVVKSVNKITLLPLFYRFSQNSKLFVFRIERDI